MFTFQKIHICLRTMLYSWFQIIFKFLVCCSFTCFYILYIEYCRIHFLRRISNFFFEKQFRNECRQNKKWLERVSVYRGQTHMYTRIFRILPFLIFRVFPSHCIDFSSLNKVKNHEIIKKKITLNRHRIFDFSCFSKHFMDFSSHEIMKKYLILF